MFQPNIIKSGVCPSVVVVGVGGRCLAAGEGGQQGAVGERVKKLQATGVGGGVSSVRVEPLAYPGVEVSAPEHLVQLAKLHAELINPLVNGVKAGGVVSGGKV